MPRSFPTKSFPIHHHSLITLSLTLYSLKAKAVPLHAMKALGWRGGMLLLIRDLCTRWGEWSAPRPGCALAPGKGPPVPIVQEAGWAPEPAWT
jgi:hypothetical protein